MSERLSVILAGGLGTRLKNYTACLPKCLLPIQGIPLLEIILRQLADHGYKKIILATHYKSNLIEDFCKDGSQWNIAIEYSRESEQLGTIGPIKLISNLPENFLIMNSDILTDMHLGQFYDRHLEKKSLFSIASLEKSEMRDYGVLQVENDYLTDFKEKPIIKQRLNMGIYMANRKILDHIPYNTFYGLNDLIAQLLSLKQPIAVETHLGKWMDIGTLQNYEQAQLAGFV